jgi:ubiquinone biosynthesis accessory factor UbiJ
VTSPRDPESRFASPAAAFESAAAGFINHLLRAASWARDSLKPFVGRTARIEVVPLALALTVVESGEIMPASVGAAPAVTLRLTPGILLRLAARDESAWREIEIAGDTDFAAAIHHVARNLRWDVEEDLSRVFGDIAAHRMAETGRTLRRWGEQAADNTARSFAEYWTEEQPLIAARHDLDAFGRAVDQLRDDAARLEKRVENHLNRQVAPDPDA